MQDTCLPQNYVNCIKVKGKHSASCVFLSKL